MVLGRDAKQILEIQYYFLGFKRGMQRYFMICDNSNRIIAIHKIYDSSYTTFRKLIASLREVEFLSLIRVIVNEFGVVQNESALHTYSASSSIIVNNESSSLTLLMFPEESSFKIRGTKSS